MRNDNSYLILYESKLYAYFRLVVSILFLLFIVIGFFKIGYWYLGILFFVAVIYVFRNVPLKVRFYEDFFTVRCLSKIEKGSYKDIHRITFHYSGPFAYPKLILLWKNRNIGFEWGSDKKYLEKMLLFFKSKQIKLFDPQSLLKNHIKID